MLARMPLAAVMLSWSIGRWRNCKRPAKVDHAKKSYKIH
jgi:hypothetical protein